LLHEFGDFLLDSGVEISLGAHVDVVSVAELIDEEFAELISCVLFIGLATGRGSLGFCVHFIWTVILLK